MVQPSQKSEGSVRPERTIKPAGNPQATSSRGRKTKVKQHPAKLETKGAGGSSSLEPHQRQTAGRYSTRHKTLEEFEQK